MLPFEFIIIGKPISHQTKDKKRLRDWKSKVRHAADNYWPLNKPLGDAVKVTITHYHDTPHGEEGVPDSDNIVKPVRDALNGIVYVDDYQITDFVSRRRSLNGSFRVKGMSLMLAEGFCQGSEFLHVKIESAPDPADLS